MAEREDDHQHDGIREWIEQRAHPAASSATTTAAESESRFSKFVSKESADR